MRASGFRRIFAALIATAVPLTAALFPSALDAQCASLESPTVGDQIQILAGSGLDGSMIDGAISMWDTGCSGQMGTDFPTLQNGGSGGASYTVMMGGHNSQNAHCGAHSGNSVTLYSSSVDSAGNRQSCGNMTMNLAHEIGHILGLNDAPETSQCEHHIMAWITRNNEFSRTVQGEECTKVDNKWKTSTEPSIGSPGDEDNPPPCV